MPKRFRASDFVQFLSDFVPLGDFVHMFMKQDRDLTFVSSLPDDIIVIILQHYINQSISDKCGLVYRMWIDLGDSLTILAQEKIIPTLPCLWLGDKILCSSDHLRFNKLSQFAHMTPDENEIEEHFGFFEDISVYGDEDEYKYFKNHGVLATMDQNPEHYALIDFKGNETCVMNTYKWLLYFDHGNGNDTIRTKWYPAPSSVTPLRDESVRVIEVGKYLPKELKVYDIPAINKAMMNKRQLLYTFDVALSCPDVKCGKDTIALVRTDQELESILSPMITDLGVAHWLNDDVEAIDASHEEALEIEKKYYIENEENEN